MAAVVLALTPVAALPAALPMAPALLVASDATAAPRAPAAPAVSTATATTSWRTRLARSFATLTPRLHARSVGVAIVVVGRSDALTLGSWRTGPAWSTVKVPLAIAALEKADSASTRSLVKRAITRSDNAAAESLWSRLGSGRRAASAVNAVLAADGDRHTRTQWRRVRPPYTPFGQTAWALADQLRFTVGLACDRHADLVRGDMAAVVASQRWGLGRLAHARIKGGWGPDTRGRYLVRQFALVPHGRALVAVVVAVEPSDGSFAHGVTALDRVAGWLAASLAAIPASPRAC